MAQKKAAHKDRQKTNGGLCTFGTVDETADPL